MRRHGKGRRRAMPGDSVSNPEGGGGRSAQALGLRLEAGHENVSG